MAFYLLQQSSYFLRQRIYRNKIYLFLNILPIYQPMKEVKITSLAKFYSLMLLYEGPKHGYDLIKTVEKKSGKKFSPGQVYPFLTKLEKNNLIKIKYEGKREKKVYMLTSKGKKFCQKLLNRFSDIIELAIEPNLSKCAHCGCEVYKGGHSAKIGKKNLTFCCKHCAASFKKSGLHNK
jgi:DNA-binding PadR family transcriptional regulator